MTAANETAILAEHEQHEAKVVAEHDVVLTVTGRATVEEIAAIVNDMESHGDSPGVHFFRDETGVRGLAITGRLSRETREGMR